MDRPASPYPGIALFLDLSAAAANDRASHPAAMLQLGVGSVDDGVDVLFRQIAVDQLQGLTGRRTMLGNDL